MLKSAERFQAKWNPVRVTKTRQSQQFEAETGSDPARLFAGFGALAGLLLAVSGGPDSLALMLLAARWSGTAAQKVPLFVATVDHGLREDSAGEAQKVGEWARQLGLSHEVLPWLGEKPAKNIQERAREARYGLLFAHARKIGATAVATAHHADDQWETIVFRLARGSGVAGLAGMARDQQFPSGRLIRPLLRLPKQALVDLCRAEGRAFFDDPSNVDPAFARTRVRALAEPLGKLGFSREMAQKLAERAKKADQALDWAAEQCLYRAAISPEADVYDLARIADAPRAVLERVLAMALARVAGAGPQRLDRLEAFAQSVSEALENGEGLRLTLGGCAARLDAKKTLELRLEGPRRRGLKAPT